jgi:RNA polymerase subunit RPABC4/transcription elongation factor Spt4
MILEDLNNKNKKCVNCNKIFPENVGICEVCGSVDFVLINDEKQKELIKETKHAEKPIEEPKEKVIEETTKEEKTEKLKEEPTKNKKSDKNQKK